MPDMMAPSEAWRIPQMSDLLLAHTGIGGRRKGRVSYSSKDTPARSHGTLPLWEEEAQSAARDAQVR